jgi:hypothetical protein
MNAMRRYLPVGFCKAAGLCTIQPLDCSIQDEILLDVTSIRFGDLCHVAVRCCRQDKGCENQWHMVPAKQDATASLRYVHPHNAVAHTGYKIQEGRRKVELLTFC